MAKNINHQFGFGGFGIGSFGSAPVQMQPVGYYQNQLTSEYKQATELQQWLASVLQVYQDIAAFFASFITAFDLDHAVGSQLDILGQNIGVSRTVGFQPSNGVSPVLDDDTFRVLLKARVAWNHWDGTQTGLWNAWQTIFPGGKIVIHDNQNMTATVFVAGSFSSIIQDLIINGYIVPRPETVEYTYSFGTLPAFGFDRNDSYIAGFDQGHWA